MPCPYEPNFVIPNQLQRVRNPSVSQIEERFLAPAAPGLGMTALLKHPPKTINPPTVSCGGGIALRQFA
jgi:hypothetical protein